MFVNYDNGMHANHVIMDVWYINRNAYIFFHEEYDLCIKLWQKEYCVKKSPDSYIEHHTPAYMTCLEEQFKAPGKNLENYLKKWKGIFYCQKNPIKGFINRWRLLIPQHQEETFDPWELKIFDSSFSISFQFKGQDHLCLASSKQN